MMARRANITDRALRYRAVKNHPPGEKRCAFCGVTRTVEVGHVNGHEEDTSDSNLIWTCRSCNVMAANTLRAANLGRLTNQYNPAGGAKTLAQWLNAVSVVTPHQDRGQGSLFPLAGNEMSVRDAVQLIRDTPASRRSSFAREIASRKRSRKHFSNPCSRRKNIWPFSSSPKAGTVDWSDYRKGRRTPSGSTSYKGYKITPTGEGFNALDSTFDTLKDAKRFIDAWVKRGNPSPRYEGEYALYTDAGLVAYGVTMKRARAMAARIKRGEVKIATTSGRVVWKKGARGKPNPADASASAYEEFHGRPSSELITVRRKIHHHGHLAAAGQLRMLKVEAIDGKHLVTIRFSKGTILAFNEDRNQLFIEGGDQSVDLKAFGISRPHELETLGKVTDIDYFTTKAHLGAEGGTAIYQHKFRTTNEGGEHVTVRVARCPDLIYRVRDEQLEFSGGSYEILAEGIDK